MFYLVIVLVACVSAEELGPNPVLMSDISRRKRSRHPVFCKHCNSYVSHPTFYRHKAKYYDSTRDTWTVSAALELSDSDSEVDILSDPEVCESGSPSSVKGTEQLRSPEDDGKLINLY